VELTSEASHGGGDPDGFAGGAGVSPVELTNPWGLRHACRVKALCGFLLVALMAASGCEKPNDLPRLQDEAVATAKILQQRLDELSQRAAALGPRVSALTPDVADSATARGLYKQATAAIEARRRDLVQQLPLGIEAAMKNGKPDDFIQLIDRLKQTQERSATDVDSALSAVESWLTIAERQDAPRAAAAGGARPSAPDPGDRAPGATGSQPPIR